MTIIDKEKQQQYIDDAQRLAIKFSVACNVMDGMLADHNGVLPSVGAEGVTLSKQEIAELDEKVFDTVNVIHATIRVLHNRITETHLFPYAENPYRQACEASRIHLQGILNKYTAKPISLGHFHDNLWGATDQFLNKLDMKNVAPSTKMSEAADKPKTPPKAEAAPKRPKGRNQTGSSSRSSSVCIPQYA